MDIFSTEFLESIRNQVLAKPKNSKVLLEAIKQLTQTNTNNKKIITQLQNQVAELRRQNDMLIEIMESTKRDIEERLKSKQKKIEQGIQIEAKLSAQNEGFMNQIDKLKGQLTIYKYLSLSLKNIEKCRKVEFPENLENTQLAPLNSQNDLNAYLYSQRDKSQTQRSGRQLQASGCISVEIEAENEEKSKVEKTRVQEGGVEMARNMENRRAAENKDNEVFYSNILNEEEEEIDISE